LLERLAKFSSLVVRTVDLIECGSVISVGKFWSVARHRHHHRASLVFSSRAAIEAVRQMRTMCASTLVWNRLVSHILHQAHTVRTRPGHVPVT
jgi:hypothetical protein